MSDDLEIADERVRALLVRRAERLARIAGDPAADAQLDGRWVAELEMGHQRWALPLESVKAVVPLRRVSPVPGAPRHVLGITSAEGELLTVLSFSVVLGLRGYRADSRVLLVVEAGEDRRVAVDCEEVPRARVLPPSAAEPSAGPVVTIPSAGDLRFIRDFGALLTALR